MEGVELLKIDQINEATLFFGLEHRIASVSLEIYSHPILTKLDYTLQQLSTPRFALALFYCSQISSYKLLRYFLFSFFS